MNALRPSYLVLCLVLLIAILPAANAGVSDEAIESSVRILCGSKSASNPNLFETIDIPFPSGTVSLRECSRGSGFVINNTGYVVTNNHVASKDVVKEDPNELVYVVQKKGDRFILHRGQVKWMSANADLAIVYCPDLRVGKPMPIYFGTPVAGEKVNSIGFPGVADMASQDWERNEELKSGLWQARVIKIQRELGRELSDEEKKYLWSTIPNVDVELSDLLGALNDVLARSSGSAVDSWDITDAVLKKPLWAGYFTPTVTEGIVSRVTKVGGFVSGNKIPVSVIQHSCNIQHGNSGGPLLNSNEEVIGVVGRGMSQTNSNDEELVSWATAVDEFKGWLDRNSVSFLTGTGPRSSSPQQTKIVVAVAASAGLGVLALIVALFKSPRGRQIVQSYSQMLSRRSGHGADIPPPIPGAEWKLRGRARDGREFRLDLTSQLFRRNDGRLVLGRSAELCHLAVRHDSVSRQHAQLVLRDGRLFLADRNSSNGSLVNGQTTGAPFQEVPVRPGDTITLGEVKFDLRNGAS